MPIIRNIIQPIIRPIISGITGAIRRVFITLDPVANAYYGLASTWVATGDFEIEVDIYIADISAITTASFVLGNSASANNGLWVNNVGRVLLRDSTGLTLTTDTTPITSGKLHSIKCSKAGGDVTIFVDGVEAEPATTFGAVNFDRIGVRQAASFFFDGIISNVRLTDLSTPSNSESYALNQLTGNTETSNGNTLTYVNIAETIDVRDTYLLSNNGTQWVGSLKTIDIAEQA